MLEPELVLEAEPELEPEADWEPVTLLSVETAAATESEELATALGEREPEADPYRLADLEMEEELEREEPAWTMEPDAAAAPEAEPEPQPAALFVTATHEGPEAAFEPEPEPDAEPAPDFEPAPEFEPAEARIATLAATVAAMAPAETPPIEPLRI